MNNPALGAKPRESGQPAVSQGRIKYFSCQTCPSIFNFEKQLFEPGLLPISLSYSSGTMLRLEVCLDGAPHPGGKVHPERCRLIRTRMSGPAGFCQHARQPGSPGLAEVRRHPVMRPAGCFQDGQRRHTPPEVEQPAPVGGTMLVMAGARTGRPDMTPTRI